MHHITLLSKNHAGDEGAHADPFKLALKLGSLPERPWWSSGPTRCTLRSSMLKEEAKALNDGGNVDVQKHQCRLRLRKPREDPCRFAVRLSSLPTRPWCSAAHGTISSKLELVPNASTSEQSSKNWSARLDELKRRCAQKLVKCSQDGSFRAIVENVAGIEATRDCIASLEEVESSLPADIVDPIRYAVRLGCLESARKCHQAVGCPLNACRAGLASRDSHRSAAISKRTKEGMVSQRIHSVDSYINSMLDARIENAHRGSKDRRGAGLSIVFPNIP